MTDIDDDLMFGDDAPEEPATPAVPAERWKMLVVDDEPEVHSITRLVLADFAFKGRAAQLLSAYSAAEAIQILEREKGIALILLDVVMETEDAGLKLVHHIREVMNNRHVRIILRTGQPGQAPERAVILEYDINDYKSKTQLTAQQLFTCTVAALRSYEDLITIDANRRGLEKIIEAASSLSKTRSMRLFATGVLTQLSALVGGGPDALLCVQLGDIRRTDPERLYVLAGTGRYEPLTNEPLNGHVEPEIAEEIWHCFAVRQNLFLSTHCAMYISTPNGRENVVYMNSGRSLSALDQQLVEVFCDKITVGFENIYLYEQLLKVQQATVATLANLADIAQIDIDSAALADPVRYAESRRLADLSESLARALHAGRQFRETIDETFLGLLGFAVMLHDVGNVVVTDGILLKPGPLAENELSLMRQHTVHGAAILKRACATVEGPNYLALGAEIARCHHENFDGTGYPNRLRGEDIPLAARIVAVADTYDALISDRPHRPAWTHEAALAEIAAQAGKRFDPAIVEAFQRVVAEGAVTS